MVSCLTCGLFFSGRVVSGQHVFGQVPPAKLAREKFKQLTVLQDMPADQMGKVMNLMSEALGVRCSYCHDSNNFAAEGNRFKDTAREMLQMTFELNEKHFAGTSRVTCMTCHRGQAKPDSSMSLPVEAMPGHKRTKVDDARESLPTVQEVLGKYQQAMGGKERLQSLPPRRLHATRREPDGRTEPEVIFQTTSTRYRLDTHYDSLVVSERVWEGNVSKLANERPIELHEAESIHIRRDAAFAWGVDWMQDFRSLVVDVASGPERWVMTGIGKEGLREQLEFDRQVGLLRERRMDVPTILGPYVIRVLYDDYRETEGIPIPWRVEYRMPSIGWVRELDRIEWNADIDERTFR